MKIVLVLINLETIKNISNLVNSKSCLEDSTRGLSAEQRKTIYTHYIQ